MVNLVINDLSEYECFHRGGTGFNKIQMGLIPHKFTFLLPPPHIFFSIKG